MTLPLEYQSVFITGTDTEVGKTVVTCTLLSAMRQAGIDAVGMKPVASGCELDVDGWLSSCDVTAHYRASGNSPPLELASPYRFAKPVSPHIAARIAGVEVSIDHIVSCFSKLEKNYGSVVVEGAGGWFSPVTGTCRMSDLAMAMRIPVILVIGLRLGCLNHAMLTSMAIKSSGARLVGWVANQIDPKMLDVEDNISYLSTHIDAPLLGTLPFTPDADSDASVKRFGRNLRIDVLHKY